MATYTRRAAGLLCIVTLIASVSARALRASPDLLIHNSEPQFTSQLSSSVFARDTPACGGLSEFFQCGGFFPSDFCCPRSTFCLQLNTTSAVTAVLCCPEGSECAAITPVTCDSRAQNATLVPQSQYHSTVPTDLETCGDSCCPSGYSCRNGGCFQNSGGSASFTTVKPTSPGTSTTLATITTPILSTSAASAATSPAASADALSNATAAPASAAPGFSGGAFAAGFIPGIIIGAIIAVCIILFIMRRRSRTNASDGASAEMAQRGRTRDTLTDLRPDHCYSSSQTTFHGRTISQPKVDLDHQPARTDFLYSTPTSSGRQNALQRTLTMSSTTTSGKGSSNKKPLFSRSPFLNDPSTPVPTQSPLPGHLKRGTLSFTSLPTISPIRGLRHQKSVTSLRRHVTNAARASTYTARTTSTRRGVSRRGSTETIQILMTPDQRPQHAVADDNGDSGPRRPRDTWISETDTTPIEDDAELAVDPHFPTHMPSTPPAHLPSSPPSLAPPYSPSMYTTGHLSTVTLPPQPPLPLMVNRQRQPQDTEEQQEQQQIGRTRSKRETTFSAMMERAGVARPDFVPQVPQVPAGAARFKGKTWRK